MNELEVMPRLAPAGTPAVASAALPVPTARYRPARTPARVTPGSGPAVTRAFRLRLRWSDASVVLAACVGVAIASGSANSVAVVALSLLIALAWLGALSVFRTRESRVLCVGVTEYRRVVGASAMTFGVLGIVVSVAQWDSARSFFLLSLPLGITGLVAERWLWRKWLGRAGNGGRALSRVVVVGTDTDVAYVVAQMRRKLGLAYSVVGAVTDAGGVDGRSFGASDVPVTHDLDRVADRAVELGADAVVIASVPRDRDGYVQAVSWSLEGRAIDLILATSLANVAGPRIRFRPVEGLPLIHVEVPQFEGARHVLKRGFDVAVAGTALLLLAPLLAVVALLVRLDSPGPALFRQERVGRDGGHFTMLKFRSMVVTAERDLAALRDRNEGSGALFKIRQDPRVTRIGRFIRKHSIDELPQLWNILVGDMSVVGPRPPLPTEVSSYEEHVHRRLYIRPGLTGMWQVNGRSTLDWEESVRLDLFYVENWSLVGDLVIMWRTLREVRSPAGAF